MKDIELNPKDPNDALSILDSIASMYQGNRKEHFAIQTAVNTLKEFIENKKENKK